MIRPPHFFEETAEEIEHERQWCRERSHTAEQLFLREIDHAIEALVEARNGGPNTLRAPDDTSFPHFRFHSSTSKKRAKFSSSP